MKRKKPGLFQTILLTVVAIIAVVGLALVLSPSQPTPPRAVSVQVPVMPPPKPEAPPILPPVGDEKTDNQAAPALPASSPSAPPLASTDHPVIAIVIDDMGLDLKDSKRAAALPAQVTLSYMPYAPSLREQTRDAREAGHELLLHMPMEPIGHDDPGPGALLVSLSPDEIRQRFQNALASFVGFDGVNNHMGSRFTADTTGMGIVIDELLQRHLFFFDSRTSAATIGASLAHEHGLPTISRDIFLDDEMTEKSITEQLAQVERVARHKGYAVAIGHPHQVTLECLEKWVLEAQKRGFTLVSLHDLVKP